MTRVTPSNSVMDKDPFYAVEQSNTALHVPKTTERGNRTRTQNGLPPGFTPARVESPPSGKQLGALTTYTYEIRVRNDGYRTIKIVVWDYVFYDVATRGEVGRHRFLNSINLKPGKEKRLVRRLVSPPTGSIDAETAGKRTNGLFFELILIKGVAFSDGTSWLPTETTAELTYPKQ